MLLQISEVGHEEVEVAISPAVGEILQRFSGFFEEPKGLPPKRSHGHHIILKEGTVLISVRPYRYPFYQKSKVEKIVHELLAARVIHLSLPLN